MNKELFADLYNLMVEISGNETQNREYIDCKSDVVLYPSLSLSPLQNLTLPHMSRFLSRTILLFCIARPIIILIKAVPNFPDSPISKQFD